MEQTGKSLSFRIHGMTVETRIDGFRTSSAIQPRSFSNHSHTSFEVYFLEEGSLTVSLEGQRITLQKGDVFLIFPGVVHRLEAVGERSAKFNLRFLLSEPLSLTESPAFLRLELQEALREEIFSNIAFLRAHQERSASEQSAFRIRSYLGMLISDILPFLFPKGRERTEAEQENTRLEQSIRLENFFLAHYGENVTLEDLASTLHYSKTHVNRILRQSLGASFSEKLSEVRIGVAKELLEESELPISRIGERCGYSTLRGFELFFFKMTGLLPREYRAKGTKKQP